MRVVTLVFRLWCVIVFGVLATAVRVAANEFATWDVAAGVPRLAHAPSAPRILKQRVFGGAGSDTAYDMSALPDGGFVVVGSTENPDRGDLDIAVLRLDDDGELVWARRVGGPGLEIGFGVCTLDDGSIAVAGWTKSFGAGEGDFYLVSLRDDGTLRFTRTFGSPREERAVAITVSRDGHLVLLGESYATEQGDAAFYVVVTDAEGDLVRERRYDGGPLNERGLCIVEMPDGFLLVGNSMDSTSGSTAVVSDGFVVRTNTSGAVLWSRRYGGAAHDIFHSAASLAPGRHLLTGYTRGFGARGTNDVWTLLIDDDGIVQSQQVIGGGGADHNISARRSPDGGAFLAGYSTSAGAGGWEAQIINVDASGAPVWTHVYGSAGNDHAVVAEPIAGARLAIAGFTESAGAGKRDILFVLAEVAPR